MWLNPKAQLVSGMNLCMYSGPAHPSLCLNINSVALWLREWLSFSGEMTSGTGRSSLVSFGILMNLPGAAGTRMRAIKPTVRPRR